MKGDEAPVDDDIGELEPEVVGQARLDRPHLPAYEPEPIHRRLSSAGGKG